MTAPHSTTKAWNEVGSRRSRVLASQRRNNVRAVLDGHDLGAMPPWVDAVADSVVASPCRNHR